MAEEAAEPARPGPGGADRRREGRTGAASGGAAKGQRRLPVAFLRPNPRNPRRKYDDADLADLAQSIREKGVVQPLLVRPLPGSDVFEIIAGERRWRAAQKAGLHDVPVLVREATDKEALELALIENIQRADLNALEEALGYQQLIDEHQYTQAALAETIGKSRSHVANTLRLLKLPAVAIYVREWSATASCPPATRGRWSPPDRSGARRRGASSKPGLSVRDAGVGRWAKATRARPRRPPHKDADTRGAGKESFRSPGADRDHRPQSGRRRNPRPLQHAGAAGRRLPAAAGGNPACRRLGRRGGHTRLGASAGHHRGARPDRPPGRRSLRGCGCRVALGRRWRGRLRIRRGGASAKWCRRRAARGP